ncbi:hypothetical protein E3983_10275 [Legionella israelensis]|uniref:Uncharacterized protein n=1 Tax=Legionella israelensis TaxID=454 RepID=A0AAX1EJQ4_9GAMM|nr:hypothetical protein E3983_10275 [Legionella israelensis]
MSVKHDSTSTNHLKPTFSLEHIQANYCVSNCSQKQKAAFADSLLKRSQMTWNEIMQAPRHKLGQETISQNSIKAPLPKDITPDTKFIALRFDGKAPMVGRRDGRVFIIYWLDHNFSLYDH